MAAFYRLTAPKRAPRFWPFANKSGIRAAEDRTHVAGYRRSPITSIRRFSSAVEQRFCKPKVGSSILSTGTTKTFQKQSVTFSLQTVLLKNAFRSTIGAQGEGLFRITYEPVQRGALGGEHHWPPRANAPVDFRRHPCWPSVAVSFRAGCCGLPAPAFHGAGFWSGAARGGCSFEIWSSPHMGISRRCLKATDWSGQQTTELWASALGLGGGDGRTVPAASLGATGRGARAPRSGLVSADAADEGAPFNLGLAPQEGA